MNVNLRDSDGVFREFTDVNAVFYSEVDDLFKVHRNGESIFESRMGEISELEIYP